MPFYIFILLSAYNIPKVSKVVEQDPELDVFLSVYLLSFYLSYNQLFFLYVVYLSIFITAFCLTSYLPYSPSIYPSWCLPIYLSICLSISIYLLSIYPLPGRLWILTSGIFVVLGVTPRSFFLGGSCWGASAPLASCARHNCLKKVNFTLIKALNLSDKFDIFPSICIKMFP